MKHIVLLLLSLILIAQTQPAARTDSISVLRADLLNSPQGAPLSGSLLGGAVLNIRGTGFDDANCRHTVTVGKMNCNTAGFPCDSETIQCAMPSSSMPDGNMSITVNVIGRGSASCRSSLCLFSYSNESTPLIMGISHKAVTVGNQPKILGYHRVNTPGNQSALGDISKIMVGSWECPRGAATDAPINPNGLGMVSCQIPPNFQAGFYNLSELTYQGWAQRSPLLSSTAFVNQTTLAYDVMVQPIVTAVSSNAGGAGGYDSIAITVSSGVKDVSKYEVTASGVKCDSLTVAGSVLTCITSPSPTTGFTNGKILNSTATQTDPYIAGAGAKFTRYDISSLSTKTVAGLRADLAGSPTSTVITTGVTTNILETDIPANIATVIKGYFKAPRTGDLKITASTNGKMALYINSAYGTATVTYATAFVEVTDGSANPNATSSTINIQNVDFYYYFELYHLSGTTNGGYATLSADISGTLFEPVTSYLMRVPATNPQVNVVINGVLAICGATNCGYTLTEPNLLVTATTYVESTSTLRIVTTDSATTPVVVALSNIVLYVGDLTIPCSGGTGTYTDFTIVITQNQDSTAHLSKGTYAVAVKFGTKYARVSSTAIFSVTMALTAVTPTSTADSGGLPLILKGRGFPESLDVSGFSVSYCGKNAQITATESGRVTIITPPCSTATTTATVTFNGTTTSASPAITITTATKPVITTISPTGFSPVSYGTLTITGTGFSSTAADCRLFLTNGTERRRIKELTRVSATTTEGVFTFDGGVAPGNYTVSFLNNEVATSTEDKVLRIETYISSLSTTTLSPYGGNSLVITGANFAPDIRDHKIIYKVGDLTSADISREGNCTITAKTSTTITCTSKLAMGALLNLDATYNVFVVVQNRYVATSQCTGGACTVTFPADKTPKTNIGSAIKVTSGATYTITGSGFKDSANPSTSPQVWIGSTQATVSAFDANNINITWPTLSSGSYPSYVVGPFGSGRSSLWNTVYPFVVNNVSVTSGALYGGITCFNGQGLRQSTATNVSLTVTGPTVITSRQYNYSADGNQICVQFIASTSAKNETFTMIYAYNGTTFDYYYLADTTKAMTLNCTDTDDQEVYQSTGVTTLDFQVTSTTPALTGLTPTHVAYFRVGSANNKAFSTAKKFDVTWVSGTSTASITNASFQTLKAGKYCFHLYVPTIGYTGCANFKITAPAIGTLAIPTVASSYLGAPSFTITGSGAGSLPLDGVFMIGSQKATLASSSALTYTIPSYPTLDSGQLYYSDFTDTIFVKPSSIVSDNNLSKTFSNDGDITTEHYSTRQECKIGLIYERLVYVQTIRFFIPYTVEKPSLVYRGLVFEGTTQTNYGTPTSYTTILTLDSKVKNGWNQFKIYANKGPYQIIRVRHTTQTSNCRFGQIQVYGNEIATSQPPATGSFSSLTPATTLSFSDQAEMKYSITSLTYQSASTPTITNVSPKYGSWKLATTVTITGTNFGTTVGDVSVKVDQVSCTVSGVTATQITCSCPAQAAEVVGTPGKFTVTILGNKAALRTRGFKYVSLWSDPQTWGVANAAIPPLPNADVLIPAGKIVLLSAGTVNVGVLTIEGSLIIDNPTSAITLNADTIIINKGGLYIGNPQVSTAPLNFDITLGLKGVRTPGKITRAIVCNSCDLQIYGNPKRNYWVPMSHSTTPNTFSTVATVNGPGTEWVSTQQVVMGPTFHSYEAVEIGTISSVAAGTPASTPDVFTLASNLVTPRPMSTGTTNVNYAVGSYVALKNRNIKIISVSGSIDANDAKFGPRILINGPIASLNRIVNLQNLEMVRCGQDKFVGGCCIHFSNNGDLMGSAVHGVMFSESNSRMLTLQGGSNLFISYNVGYNIAGSGIVLETGSEMGNSISYNLIMRLISNPSVNEPNPIGLLITNPANTVSSNVISGSDSDGIVFRMASTTRGLGYSRTICPEGIQANANSLDNNVAHSNKRYGLRIQNYAPRTFPCGVARNNSLANPFSANPPMSVIFSGYNLYANSIGLYAQNIGQVDFTNFLFGDNEKNSLWFDKADLRPDPITITTSTLILMNIPINNALTHQLVTPPSNNAIKFFNCKHANDVNYAQTINLLQKPWPIIFDGGFTYDAPGSPRANQKYILKWDVNKTNIIYDKTGKIAQLADGSVRSNSIIVPNHAHLIQSTVCPNFASATTYGWDPSLICAQTNFGANSGRTVTFSKVVPASLTKPTVGASLKIYQIASATEDISAVTTGITTIADQGNKWAAPFISGQIYAVWWNYDTDFRNLSMSLSPSYVDGSDKAIILRFNYTETKELLEVGRVLADKLQFPLITASVSALTTTCSFGQYYHDSANKYISICLSDNGRTTSHEVRLNALNCVLLCNDTANNITRENTVRLWSDAANWPSSALPVAGANVTIPANWTMKLDVDPPALNSLIVEGSLFVDNRNTALQVGFMWVKGNFWAGSVSSPFAYTLDITVKGNASSPDFIYDGKPVKKAIVVTGNMTLYSSPSLGSHFGYLNAKVAATATAVTLQSSINWAANDEVVLTPTFNDPTQYEFRTLASASSTSSITLSTATTHTHFGDVSGSSGSVDKTGVVLHMSRKIRIISETSAADNFGFRVIVTSLGNKKGAVIFKGVQFKEGGQPDSDRAALHFLDTGSNSLPSLVNLCSFTKCNGNCITMVNNSNITVSNTNFAEGRRHLVYAERQRDYVFSSNLMTGALVSRSLASQLNDTFVPEQVACYFHPWVADTESGEINQIISNECYGSQYAGFVTALNPCGLTNTSTNGFSFNTAGAARIGYLLNGQPNKRCQYAADLYAFANRIGLVTNPPATNSLIIRNFNSDDNQLAMSIKQGYGRANSGNMTTIIENAKIYVATRSTCDYCYGTTITNCTNARGIRWGSSTFNGKSTNDTFGQNIEMIDSPAAYDSKLFIKSSEFVNFQSAPTANIATCTNPLIFDINPNNIDTIGSINLLSTKCTNCELPKTLIKFPRVPEPSVCPNCNGLANYYIRDDSLSFNSNGAYFYVPDNSSFATAEGCVANTNIQGYACQRNDIVVLQFESISKDYDSRIVWPVTLSYNTAKWSSTVSAPKQWPGFNQPARFAAMLIASQTYQMTFNGQPPGDMRLSLQQKTDSLTATSDFVVLNITYTIPNVAVRVTVDEAKMQPLIASDLTTSTSDFSTTCGANKYFQDNGTISFVVTNNPTCEVRVKLVSSVIVSMTLATDKTSFETNGGTDVLRKSIATFLNIKEDRVVITNLRTGSVIVDYFIQQQVTSTVDNSTDETVNQQQTYDELQNLANQVQNAGSSLDTGGLGSVVGVSTTTNVINTDGSTMTNPTTDNKVAIIVGVVVGVLGAIGLGIGIYFIVKKFASKGQAVNQDPNVSQEKIAGSDTRGINYESSKTKV